MSASLYKQELLDDEMVYSVSVSQLKQAFMNNNESKFTPMAPPQSINELNNELKEAKGSILFSSVSSRSQSEDVVDWPEKSVSQLKQRFTNTADLTSTLTTSLRKLANQKKIVTANSRNALQSKSLDNSLNTRQPKSLDNSHTIIQRQSSTPTTNEGYDVTNNRFLSKMLQMNNDNHKDKDNVSNENTCSNAYHDHLRLPSVKDLKELFNEAVPEENDRSSHRRVCEH